MILIDDITSLCFLCRKFYPWISCFLIQVLWPFPEDFNNFEHIGDTNKLSEQSVDFL